MLNEPAMQELIDESQDLHTDAMREVTPNLSRLTEHHHDVPQAPLDPARVDEINRERRSFMARTGAMLATGGLLTTGIGTSLLGLLATPASADTPLDVQILQTAVSLELLAVATYKAALGLPFIAGGNPVVKKFAETTMSQHDQHRQAFSAQTTALGGTDQTVPNPKYAPVVEAAKPTLKAPADVVTLAATLETVATETYLNNLMLLGDNDSKALFASVMGVECQHLATLRAVGALLAGGDAGAALIAIPTDVSKLPAAAGSVAFPQPFEPTTMASPPPEGAVK